MFNQLPPHDIAAEEAVVASVMVDETAMSRVVGLVKPGDFYREANRWTFEACLALYERDEAINQITVAHELDRRGKLSNSINGEDVGGLSFLSDLILNLPTAIGCEHYAAIVHRDAVYRQMVNVAYKVTQIAYEAGADLNSSLAQAEALVYSLRREGKSSALTRLSEYLDPYLDEPEEMAPMRVGGAIRTGLAQLDALLGGLRPGNLIIVGARTSFGKTSLMLNMARNAAVIQNAHVAFFSLEMTGEEIAQRVVQSDARLTKETLERGRYDEAQGMRLMQTLGLLHEAELYVDYAPGLSYADLRAKAIKLASEKGLDLVVVDYLQLLTSGRNLKRYDEVTYLSGQLKQLAGELDVPLLVGCQLNRQVEGRPGHMPLLSDLRESGAIEQDADVVMFIHLEDKYSTQAQWERQHPNKVTHPYPRGQATLKVAKFRSGQMGEVDVRFRQEYTRFEDFDVAPSAPVQGRAW